MGRSFSCHHLELSALTVLRDVEWELRVNNFFEANGPVAVFSHRKSFGWSRRTLLLCAVSSLLGLRPLTGSATSRYCDNFLLRFHFCPQTIHVGNSCSPLF